VFGQADGAAPRAPRGISAQRSDDPRQMTVRWRPVPGAVGYNVRWGTAPDRLNSTYQVFADQGTVKEIRALSRGVGYHVAVEAFDEHGVSPLSQVLSVP